MDLLFHDTLTYFFSFWKYIPLLQFILLINSTLENYYVENQDFENYVGRQVYQDYIYGLIWSDITTLRHDYHDYWHHDHVRSLIVE